MASKKFYTNEEDLVIIGEVRMYPQNIQLAFESASIKLGRKVSGIAFRWYKYLKNNTEHFVLSGEEVTAPINTKNQPRTKTLTGIVNTIQVNLKNIENSLHKLDGIVNDAIINDIKTSLNEIYKVF